MEKGNTSLVQVRVWIPDLEQGWNKLNDQIISICLVSYSARACNPAKHQVWVGFSWVPPGSDKLRKKIAALHSCTDGDTISM